MADVLLIEERGFENEKPIYGLFLDNSRSYGMLHCTHEIDVSFFIEDKHPVFYSAWEIGIDGDWDYNQEDVEEFKSDHPEILPGIEKHLQEGTYKFR